MARLNEDAARIALRFQLRYQSIEAERPQVTARYGICYSDGRIKIRLRHVTTGRPLRYSSLVNTLCHELAHLRHMNHGPRFKAFYFKVLEWARSEGIYRPGTAEGTVAAGSASHLRTVLPAAAREVPARRRDAAATPRPPTAAPDRITTPARTGSVQRPKPVQLTLFPEP